MNDLKQLTPAEFARLAYTARGFGPGGRLTLVQHIAEVAASEAEAAVARQALKDAIDDVRKTVAELRSS